MGKGNLTGRSGQYVKTYNTNQKQTGKKDCPYEKTKICLTFNSF